ncbi:MAG: protease complex subunit PrcB family protein [Cyanobacteria bacterium]|nr:protease complex subunit PrcB family protein [Cyanobacteriota bacterium]
MLLTFAMQTSGVQAGHPAARVIVQDDMSMIDEPRQAVARTQSEWEALWRSHGVNKPAPKVDFGKESVVAIFLGSRPTPGFSAHVVRAGAKGRVLTVEWTERRPESGSILAQVLTSPVLFAAVPKFDGEIKFQKVEP